MSIQEEPKKENEEVPQEEAPNEEEAQQQPKDSFVLRTRTPAEWKIVTACIQSAVLEATINVSAEGIKFRAMDPSHISLVDLVWDKAGFERFDYTGTKKSQGFTVRLEDFSKLIRRADPRQSLEIERNGNEPISIRLGSANREFQLHLFDGPASTTPIPKLDYKSHVTLTLKAWQRALDDIGAVSDHVTILTKKDALVFSGKGDTGNAESTLSKESANVLALDVMDGDQESTYSLYFLNSITKAVGDMDKLRLEYSSNMPLRIEVRPADPLLIHFYLAPRMQPESKR